MRQRDRTDIEKRVADTMRRLGARLLEARVAAGMTQTRLGESTGLGQAGISRLERSHFSHCELTTLVRLSKALDKPLSYFLA